MSDAKDKGTSLDMIEDCLEAIYRSRKATLLSRARKFKEKQKTKKPQVSSPNRAYSNYDDYGDLDDDDDDGDNGQEESDGQHDREEGGGGGAGRGATDRDRREYEADALKNISLPSVIGTAPPRFAPSEYEVVAEISKSKKGVSIEELQQRGNTPKLNNRAGASGAGSRAGARTVHMSGDQIALGAFETFCVEIVEWSKDEVKLKDEDKRGDYCDHLIDKYLANSLDILDASAVVSQVRKDISHAVEEFASEGTLPSAVIECHRLVVEQETEQEAEKMEKKVKGGGGGGSSNEDESKLAATDSNSSSKKVGFRDGTKASTGSSASTSTIKMVGRPEPPADKAEAEKVKIKQQYEQFMKLKKKTEEHPDEAKIADMTNLNDDIQALLSSIQKK